MWSCHKQLYLYLSSDHMQTELIIHINLYFCQAETLQRIISRIQSEVKNPNILSCCSQCATASVVQTSLVGLILSTFLPTSSFISKKCCTIPPSIIMLLVKIVLVHILCQFHTHVAYHELPFHYQLTRLLVTGLFTDIVIILYLRCR